MGLILKFLGGPFGIYAMIAIGVLLAGSMGYGAYQHQAAERYQVERDAAKETVTQLKVAVASKDVVIGRLDKALQAWKLTAELSSAAYEKAADRVELYEADLKITRATLAALAEKDRASDICTQVLSIDLATACPNFTKRVRDTANRRF